MNANIAYVKAAFLLLTAILLSSKSVADPVSYQVSGTIVETIIQTAIAGPHELKVHAKDIVSGDLEGTAQLFIHSSEIVDFNTPIVLNVISTRRINTREGLLFLSEVGSRVGDEVNVTSTVIGGTGKFKNATGQLILSGVHPPGITVEFTYFGTIVLSQ